MNPVPGRRWSGLFSALLVFLAGFLIVSGSQIGAAVLAGMRAGESLTDNRLNRSLGDGDVLSLAFASALPTMLGLLYLVIRFWHRRNMLEYLSVRAVSLRALVQWGLGMLGLLGAYLAVGTLLDRPEMPRWMLDVYRSVDVMPAFIIAVAGLGPLLEEALYRGYMLTAVAESPVGPFGAALIVSALWAITHFQYDWFDVAWIFVFGLLLCTCRLITGSLVAPFVLHALWNLISTVAVFVYLR